MVGDSTTGSGRLDGQGDDRGGCLGGRRGAEMQPLASTAAEKACRWRQVNLRPLQKERSLRGYRG